MARPTLPSDNASSRARAAMLFPPFLPDDFEILLAMASPPDRGYPQRPGHLEEHPQPQAKEQQRRPAQLMRASSSPEGSHGLRSHPYQLPSAPVSLFGTPAGTGSASAIMSLPSQLSASACGVCHLGGNMHHNSTCRNPSCSPFQTSYSDDGHVSNLLHRLAMLSSPFSPDSAAFSLSKTPSSTLTSVNHSPISSLSSPSSATKGTSAVCPVFLRTPDQEASAALRIHEGADFRGFFEEDVVIIDGFLVNDNASAYGSTNFSPSCYHTPPPGMRKVSLVDESGLRCRQHPAKHKDKDDLRWIHPRPRGARQKTYGQQICKAFAKSGDCIYGKGCRNIHAQANHNSSRNFMAVSEDESRGKFMALSEDESPVRVLQLCSPSNVSRDSTTDSCNLSIPPSSHRRLPVFEQICPSFRCRE